MFNCFWENKSCAWAPDAGHFALKLLWNLLQAMQYHFVSMGTFFHDTVQFNKSTFAMEKHDIAYGSSCQCVNV